MQILHFSDIHLPLRWRTVPFKDWMGKRLIGGANLLLRRAQDFAAARKKMVALDLFRREHRVDLVVCTGDYTALGTRAELQAARQAVEPLMQAPLGYVNVPGNHDIYLLDALREKRWSEHFGDTFVTDLPQHRVDGGPWPFVRLLGDGVAVVGVNSARPNPQPWRSNGRIPARQLEALAAVLADPALRGRFVFVITHYSPRLEDGRPDSHQHGLVNADAFLAVCASLPRGAILCGHVHRRYMVRVEGVRTPIFCAGSTTKADREGLWVFDIDDSRVRAIPGGWRGARYVLDRNSAVEV